jgi:hypothetical protein
MSEYFFLTTDDSGHWYVVPLDKTKEWQDWVDMDGNIPESWDAPTWAYEVGGCPSKIIFKDWKWDD